MKILELISAIFQKHKDYGITINPSASIYEIESFQNKTGIKLPDDFIEFYSYCNGFVCNDDIFNMKRLDEIVEYKEDYGSSWFHFSDYMINSDLWSVRMLSGSKYEIFNTGEIEIVLTNSLQEFLERFLNGGVFEKDGLYKWHDEITSK